MAVSFWVLLSVGPKSVAYLCCWSFQCKSWFKELRDSIEAARLLWGFAGIDPAISWVAELLKHKPEAMEVEEEDESDG